MCSARQKGNISSLQTIFKREDESIRDFTRRFCLGGGGVQQIDSFSKIFGGALGRPHRSSTRLDPPTKMEELYRQADKYSTLEDNIRAASQTVIITAQSGKPATKGQPEPKGSKNQKRSRDQLERKREPPQFTPLNISYDRLLPLIRDHPDFKWLTPIQFEIAVHN